MDYKQIDLKSKKITKKTYALTVPEKSDDVIGHILNLYQNYNKNIHHPKLGSTKNRALMMSGGAKPYRQKGTGRARRGTNRTPLRVGGAITFGPQPREISRKLNKKVKNSIFSYVLNQENTKVVLKDNDDALKVKDMVKLLEECGYDKSKKVVSIFDDSSYEKSRFVGNLRNNKVQTINNVSVQDVIAADILIFSAESFELITNRIAVGEKS